VKRRAIPIVASLVGASLVGLLIYGVSAQSASRTLDEAVARHESPPAPEATRALPVLGAAAQSALVALRGKVVVMNVWASWCEPCQVEAPLLARAQPLLARHNATVLGITYEDNSPDSVRFVRQYHLTYPNLRDVDGSFARGYGTNVVPESFLIDRRGNVRAISRGEIDQTFVQRALALAQSS
jgi:cytochrome c biogenesis protein CcmG/thiol:disulfide interchange protein DsbE